MDGPGGIEKIDKLLEPLLFTSGKDRDQAVPALRLAIEKSGITCLGDKRPYN